MTAIENPRAVTDPDAPPAPAPPLSRDRLRGGLRSAALAIAFGVAVVLVMELLVQTNVISRLLVPPPSAVLARLGGVLAQIFTLGPIAQYAWETLSAMLISLAISLVLGVSIGTLLGQSRIARTLLYPYVLAFNAAPRIVFAPMFVIWFGIGMTSRLVMAVSIGMFPIIVGTLAGLARADAQTDKLMVAVGATRWQRFRMVDFPTALPYIIAGAETASVLCAVGVIIGEFTAGNDGLGYLVVVAQDAYDFPTVFALVMIVAVMGILLNGAVMLVGRRLVFWGRSQR